MSINPVPAVGNATNTSLATGGVRSSHVRTPEPQGPSPQTNSGPEPKQEIRHQPQTSETLETAKDEVQVQRDSESNGQIVIRYLDHAGQVILQVPSSQILGLARAIERALEEQATRRNSVSQERELGERRTTNGR
jgi:uncharacterized FlaG/YvyC family protein